MNDVTGISDRLRYRLPLSILFSLSSPCTWTEAVSNVHQWETEIMGRRQLLATTQFAYFPWDLSPNHFFLSFLRRSLRYFPFFVLLPLFFLTWSLRRKDNGQESKDFWGCSVFKHREDLKGNKPSNQLTNIKGNETVKKKKRKENEIVMWHPSESNRIEWNWTNETYPRIPFSRICEYKKVVSSSPWNRNKVIWMQHSIVRKPNIRQTDYVL